VDEAGDVVTGTVPIERVGLRDGRVIRLRPVERADADALAAFHVALSIETRHFRFFSTWRPSAEDATRLASPDDDSFAVVAETDDPGVRRIVGDARWNAASEGVAEMAIAVADDFQGAGLGKALLRHLASEAHRQHIHTFTATVLGANDRMRHLLDWWGFVIIDRDGADTVQVALATAGGLPGWTPRRAARRRVLVEGRGWLGRADVAQLTALGYQVTQCPGPSPTRRPCPLLRSSRCAVADEADVIVCALGDDALLAAHARAHPDVPVVTTAADLLSQALGGEGGQATAV
jgi:acetyltransferase